MQHYAIGLDVGVTSVGWSVVALKDDRPCQIIGMGSRIFAAAEHPKTGASLAAPRREARSVRRRLRRHRLRNTRIRDLLIEKKIVSEGQLFHLFEGRLEDIYALRVRALDEKMTGPEMARILIHLSQRRGFRSNRKNASAGEDGKLLKAVNKNVAKMAECGYRTVAEMLLQDKEFAVQDSKEGFVTSEHFGLGMWIRNHWIHRIDTPDEIANDRYNACYRMLTGSKEDDPRLIDPDSISSDFLEKYYDHLKELVAADNPSISVRRKPAKCPHCGGNVLSIKYGEPGPEMMAGAERGEFLLGGCCISPESPDFKCANCGQTFIRDIIDR